MKIIAGWRRSNQLARFDVFLLVAVLITGVPCSYGGCGDDNHPSQNLEIRTWYDLDAIRDNLDGNHTLMNDLDSGTAGYEELASPTANAGKGWQPIGYSTVEVSWGCSKYVADYGLTGTFDGQGHEIRDLFINPDEFAAGLFTYLIDGGIIKNVGVVNITVVGYNVVGSLVGSNHGGTVSNCYSNGNVTGRAAIGGLVGRNIGTISNSYCTGRVTGSFNVGGLVGQQHPGCSISNCYSSCTVILNLDPEGPVGGTGGLVGSNGGTVSSSFWDTETSGQSTSGGGIGKNTTEMKNITTFTDASWNIMAVTLNQTNRAYIWNIIDGQTYPFLSWQSVS
ncbi:MAG: hypothetical protein OEV52_02640 [Dehalococcoidia bacterium]|nr:hypothetical protein [Dehalococcoidia bacterium]MDH4292326.1 hypothetical protein [Dehalococcoidia bacterium]